MRRLLLPLLCTALLVPPSGGAAQSGGRAEVERLDRQIRALRGELVAQARAERAGQDQTEAQRARLDVLNAREAVIQTRIDRNRGQLARLLGALQMHRRHPPPPLLVNPRSAKDAVRAAILIRAITPELEARGKAFAAEAEAVARIRRGAAVASEALFEAESDVADARAEIDRLLAEKRALEERLFDDDAAEAQAQALAARVGSVGELVEELAAANRPAAAPAVPERFVPPVQGEVVRRFAEALPSGARSQGWAWQADPGAPVLSPAAARVDYAGPLKGWGTVVILRVGGGYRLVLAGMDSVDVGVGREVAAGEPVGRMAQAPPRRGAPRPELYLEVRNQAAPVNPARWLNGTKRG